MVKNTQLLEVQLYPHLLQREASLQNTVNKLTQIFMEIWCFIKESNMGSLSGQTEQSANPINVGFQTAARMKKIARH